MSYIAVRLVGIIWNPGVRNERRGASSRIVDCRRGVSQRHHKLGIQICLGPRTAESLVILAT